MTIYTNKDCNKIALTQKTEVNVIHLRRKIRDYDFLTKTATYSRNKNGQYILEVSGVLRILGKDKFRLSETTTDEVPIHVWNTYTELKENNS